MADSDSPRFDPEAGRAARGLVFVGLGQVGCFVVGMATAMLLPRFLGAVDYGHWIVFRGLVALWVAVGGVGTPEIVGRFYVAQWTAGDREGAGRVLKAIFALRLGLAVLAGGAGAWLLTASTSAFSSWIDALLLAACIVVQVIGLSYLLLLYSERSFAGVAVVNLLYAGVVPFVVLALHVGGWFAWTPWGCLLGDILCAAFAVGLAPRGRLRASGWPCRSEFRSLLGFGLAVALSAVLMAFYGNVLPYLMNRRAYAMEAVGYVGLATRLSGVFSTALLVLGGALFPSLTVVMQRRGLDKALDWQNRVTRTGFLGLVALLGLFVLTRNRLVPLVFGADFQPAIPAMTVVLFGLLPLWFGGQLARVALLIKRPIAYTGSIVLMLAVFLAVFLALPPDRCGQAAAWAVLLGALAHAAMLGILFRAYMRGERWIYYVAPLAVLAGAFWPASRGWSVTGSLAAGGIWLLLLGIVGFGSRAIVLADLRDLLRAFASRSSLRPNDGRP